MTMSNRNKLLANRLKAPVTSLSYQAALQQVERWQDTTFTADDSDHEVVCAEIRYEMLTATGGDLPVEVTTLGMGIVGVEMSDTSGRPARLSVWELDGIWGFTWMADEDTILCYGNFVDGDGDLLTTAMLSGNDGKPTRALLAETVRWLATTFATDPTSVPTDPPAGVQEIIVD